MPFSAATGQAATSGWELGRRPALDGLRGIAIGLVLLGHLFPRALSNFGSVGVTVFFALSGFLITSLFLDERSRTGGVSLSGFYSRRVRRLLPILGVYLAVLLAFGALGIGPWRYQFGQVLAVLFYATNWLMALHQPVAASLGITWSLSVEEQFYLLWPLVFVLGRRWPRLPVTVAVVGVVFAVAARLAAWDAGMDGWSIYYRTDTRMDSLLVGALLAFAAKAIGPARWWRHAGLVGIAALAVLLAVNSDSLHYLAEPLFAALAGGALIASVLAGGTAWLCWSPLCWLGRRSYALYLWHYPLMWMAVQMGQFPPCLALAGALGLAELSWWLVERPVSRWGRSRSNPVRPHGPLKTVAAELPGPVPPSTI